MVVIKLRILKSNLATTPTPTLFLLLQQEDLARCLDLSRAWFLHYYRYFTAMNLWFLLFIGLRAQFSHSLRDFSNRTIFIIYDHLVNLEKLTKYDKWALRLACKNDWWQTWQIYLFYFMQFVCFTFGKILNSFKYVFACM